uniref:Uncharacterized protein n=2 Tax=Clytia hemisphaerica TaxID=252671 RepID=A0A7M5VBK1_9CNID
MLSKQAISDIADKCSSTVHSCKPPDFEVLYAYSYVDQAYFFIADANINTSLTEGCWGFGLEVATKNDRKSMTYYNFIQNDVQIEHAVQVILKQSYSFDLYTFPLGLKESITLKAPDECGNQVLSHIYEVSKNKTKKSEKNCSDCTLSGLTMKMDFAEEVCHRYENKTTRNIALNQRMKCNEECILILTNGTYGGM